MIKFFITDDGYSQCLSGRLKRAAAVKRVKKRGKWRWESTSLKKKLKEKYLKHSKKKKTALIKQTP